ncbi:hypothetical protein [Desulfosarcina sp.]|uniref:hypothetical protein n=1 Tax=Desulfosarcina sp. TaxID=2027861 RepID=UPI0029BE3A08|nr:hypothetical protein [Desulfosarcina sp.]MDX2451995.1 hypothetical protein [Desulfosarcina sp.]MDX2489779.1 hypothetical protein [Desulfosarcina sp.]
MLFTIKLYRIFFYYITILILLSSASHADWINLSGAENARNIAEIYVEKDRVRILMEIFVDDLTVFAELIPESFFSEPLPGRPGLAKRQQIFAERVLQVVTDQGEKLHVNFALVEPRIRVKRPSPFAGKISPFTRQIIPGPPADKRVLYAELIYPFEEKPKSLTFIPPQDDNGLPKSSIGFICNHQGVTVVDFRILSQGSTLHLNWDDPWYSEFDKKPLRRKIGSGMRTFLYIEPFEVRNEILVRVKDMMNWIDFDLRGDKTIEEDEFNRVREQIGQFFMERENVRIDGQRLKPILDRTAFVESSLQRSRFIEIPEQVPLNSAMVGVIVTYLTDGMPQEVTTTWELFSERVQNVTARMTDPAGPFPYDLTPDDNVLKWNNYLKTYTIPTVEKINVADQHRGVPVPLGSVVCIVLLLPISWSVLQRRKHGDSVKPLFGLIGLLFIGALVLIPVFQVPVGGSARASQFAAEDGQVVLDSLMKNVYRAFDFRDEEDVYDKLAICVSGELLSDLYLQQRRSLVVEQAGGAQAKVKEVAIEDVVVGKSTKHDGALDLRAQWTALGQVGHWGHVHSRQNRYDAIVTIKPMAGAWKIIDLELIEENRLF